MTAPVEAKKYRRQLDQLAGRAEQDENHRAAPPRSSSRRRATFQVRVHRVQRSHGCEDFDLPS